MYMSKIPNVGRICIRVPRNFTSLCMEISQIERIMYEKMYENLQERLQSSNLHRKKRTPHGRYNNLNCVQCYFQTNQHKCINNVFSK